MNDSLKPSTPPKLIPPGSTVWVTIFGRRRAAQVVEDRGYIGPNGERLIRIRVPLDHGDEHMEFVVTWDDVAQYRELA
jgi:hypothetical protein